MVQIEIHVFLTWYLFSWTLKKGTEKLSRNVGKNYHHTLCNIAEENGSLVLYVGELLNPQGRVLHYPTDCRLGGISTRPEPQ